MSARLTLSFPCAQLLTSLGEFTPNVNCQYLSVLDPLEHVHLCTHTLSVSLAVLSLLCLSLSLTIQALVEARRCLCHRTLVENDGAFVGIRLQRSVHRSKP